MLPNVPDRSVLAEQAHQLLAAHHGAEPLLLANVWDAASARVIEAAGFRFVATSSRAVAEVLGEADDDSSDPTVIFDWTARIARAVSVPVTADVEAGFGLTPTELVDRLLAAGAVGCNLEDTEHHGDSPLIDADRQASYIADVRAASEKAGVHIVVNARTDTFMRHVGDERAQLDEAIRRGRLYLEAGADCVYPMAVARKADAAVLVSSVPGPVNLVALRGGLSIAELAGLGVRRISLASGVFQLIVERLSQVADALVRGGALEEL